MKTTLSLNDHEAILEMVKHLRELFSHEGGCPHCGIIAPIRGTKICVVEAIETCHPQSGKNLDANNALPPGNYEIVGHVQHRDGASHWLHLRDLKTDQPVELCYGYSKVSLMDWRGILPFIEEMVEAS